MLIRESKISWIFAMFSISPQTNYWVAIHGIWWMQAFWNRMTGKSWTRSFRRLWMPVSIFDIFVSVLRKRGWPVPAILSFFGYGYSWLIIFCRSCHHRGMRALWLRICHDGLDEMPPFFHKRTGSSTGKIFICSFCTSCQLVLSSRNLSPYVIL